MFIGHLSILDWNIAGAKYLELKESAREDFRARLNQTLHSLIDADRPDVVTLQEVVKYQPAGVESEAVDVIDMLPDYAYHPLWSIDTHHQSATPKWDKVRERAGWSSKSYFAQGNAFLIKRGLPCFRVFDLPIIGELGPVRDPLEVVKLESGLYLGDRDTEPRAAMIVHIVPNFLKGEGSECELRRPLDIFVVNLHLTTLNREREGVPKIDDEATRKRLGQLEIVLNGIVSPYNTLRKEGYKIRGRQIASHNGDAVERHNPIWVIAGDFNFTPESVEYQTMIRAGFIDLVPKHDLGTKTSGLGRKPTLTVDYVFAGPRFASIDPGFAQDNTTHNHVLYNERTKVSDHFPLVVSVPIALPHEDGADLRSMRVGA